MPVGCHFWDCKVLLVTSLQPDLYLYLFLLVLTVKAACRATPVVVVSKLECLWCRTSPHHLQQLVVPHLLWTYWNGVKKWLIVTEESRSPTWPRRGGTVLRSVPSYIVFTRSLCKTWFLWISLLCGWSMVLKWCTTVVAADWVAVDHGHYQQLQTGSVWTCRQAFKPCPGKSDTWNLGLDHAWTSMWQAHSTWISK